MASSIDEYIGRRLQAKRQEFGLSIDELANAISTTPSTLEDYERGSLRIGAPLLASLCGIFNVSPG